MQTTNIEKNVPMETKLAFSKGGVLGGHEEEKSMVSLLANCTEFVSASELFFMAINYLQFIEQYNCSKDNK